MSAPRLRHHWRSPACHRVRIALALKEVVFESELVDAPETDRMTERGASLRPDLPALAIDDVALTQSLAIIEYLDETRPEPPLLPGPVAERARVRALADAIAMDIAPLCSPRVVDHVVWLTASGEHGRETWRRRFMLRGLQRVESLLDSPMTGRFAHGDRPGYADCVLIPQLTEARRLDAPLWKFPRITAVELRCASHPAFVAAHPDAWAPPTKADRR